MPTCRGCGGEYDAADLVRHERDGVVVVHCPNCQYRMGTWRDPAGHPDDGA